MELFDNTYYMNRIGDKIKVKITNGNYIAIKDCVSSYIVEKNGKYSLDGEGEHPFDIIEPIMSSNSNDNIIHMYIMDISYKNSNMNYRCNSIPDMEYISKFIINEFDMLDFALVYTDDNTFIYDNGLIIKFTPLITYPYIEW